MAIDPPKTSDILQPLWDKLDNHHTEIGGINKEVYALKGELSTLRVEQSNLMKEQASLSSTLNIKLDNITKEVGEITKNQYIQQGKAEALKESKKSNIDWISIITPAAITLYLAYNVVGGG